MGGFLGVDLELLHEDCRLEGNEEEWMVQIARGLSLILGRSRIKVFKIYVLCNCGPHNAG
jgi:hypothetical protein